MATSALIPHVPISIVPTVLIALVLHRVCVVIYNIFFHPLAAFPGPRLAAATSLWLAYTELYGKQNFTTKLVELHAQYGDVVRISPNELHFANPVAYHDIYNAKNRWNKDAKLYNALRSADGHASFHLTVYQDAKRRREPMIPLFSRSSILSMQHLLQDNVRASRPNLTPQAPHAISYNLIPRTS
ncbi:hypothetical protein NM688_g6559 [Phlebia brevispora]|uniref:Uncharacterized protein n=1 Tax=Phlebia brevispora TaxID=194682 RepID=A0ACC1SEN5_9APHY|nr:hypothetical protein NM688_g6559 [Phlebia brevispora]